MNQKSLKTLSIALFVLLIGAIIYIFQLKSQLDNQLNSIETIQKEKSLLKTEIDSLDVELSHLEDINLQQDSTLQNTLKELDQRKTEIQRLLSKSDLSSKEVQTLKNKINSLKSEINSFKSQIAQLQKENQELRLANDTLNIENFQVRDSLSNVKKAYTDVQSKYTDEKNKVANTLSVSNFSITPMKVRRSGKEVEKTRANSVNKLTVNFKLDPNSSASDGPKTLYISIYKPDGKIANFSNGSSGTFIDKNGATVNYSDKITIDYSKNSGSEVNFDWDYENFTAGTYKIDVYQNGFKIGQETKTLK